MLTPIEIQRKSFKNGGFGYDKREVDEFLEEVEKDYETLYKENVEYKDKINVLSDGLQYYKSIEKTLQKALVLAQRTADEAHADAVKKADDIEREAHIKAEQILQEARRELERIHAQSEDLLRSYDNFRANIRSLAAAETEMLDSASMNASVSDLESFLRMEKPLKDLRIEQHEAAMNIKSVEDDDIKIAEPEDDPVINPDVEDEGQKDDTIKLNDLAKIKEKVNRIEKADRK